MIEPVRGQTYTSFAGNKATVVSVTKTRVTMEGEAKIRWTTNFTIFNAVYGGESK